MRILLLAILLALQGLTIVPVNADVLAPTSDSSMIQERDAVSGADLETQIQRLDRQILFELIKLAEFNVHYQQEVNHYARWRSLFYPLAQEATYACFLGYHATDISQKSRGWKNPRVISPTSLKAGLSSALVGSLIGSGSSLVELAANGAETVHAGKKGFSGKKSASAVRSSLARIDDLLARRHNLMNEAGYTGNKQELLELKEQLLRYERDRLIFEFKRWNAHSRSYAWYKNSFYIINASVNLARFSAVLLGYKAFTARGCSGGVGPLLISSSILAGLGPWASTTVGTLIQHRQKKLLANQFGDTQVLSDEDAKRKFEQMAELLSDPAAGIQQTHLLSELVKLREEKIGLDKLIYHEEKHIERLRVVAGQQAITAPLISTLGLTSGILSTVGYHKYRNRPVVSNRLGFAGDTAILAAEAVALIATPAAAIKTELYERNLKKQNEHPSQLLTKRLEDLKKLEAILSGELQLQ